MMQVSSASEPAPGRPENEDHVFQFGQLVGVLDGATVPAGFDTGCVHGPAWYVRRLAARIGVAAADRPEASLMDTLATAIAAVRGDHDGSCDLNHAGTPSSTVCLARDAGDHLDYLVLCDSPLVVDLGGRVRAVTDDRLATTMARVRAAAPRTAPPGSAEHAAEVRRVITLQRQHTNQPDGYWVASVNPDAAYHAVAGTLPLTGPGRVRRAALLTDGASCAVEMFALYDWAGLLDVLTDHGPGELIRRVRIAETALGEDRPRYKRHDDATAALCLFVGT